MMSWNLILHVCETRKFVMAILHGKQGLLCDKMQTIDWSKLKSLEDVKINVTIVIIFIIIIIIFTSSLQELILIYKHFRYNKKYTYRNLYNFFVFSHVFNGPLSQGR